MKDFTIFFTTCKQSIASDFKILMKQLLSRKTVFGETSCWFETLSVLLGEL